MKRYQVSKLFKVTLLICTIGIVLLFSPFVYFGIAGLTVAAVLFLTVGGIQTVYVKPFEDSRRYKECLYGKEFDLEVRLQKEKQNLERYRMEQRNAWKSALIGVGLLLGGIAVIVLSLILYSTFILFILGIFPGFYLVLMSFTWFWSAFVNSDLALAETVSDLFLLRSCPVKIEETSKLVSVLTRRVREEKEAEEKRREDGDNQRLWFGPGVWEEKKEQS